MAFLQQAYFYGCIGRPGHYLKGPRFQHLDDKEQWTWFDRMTCLDGTLAPEGPEVERKAQGWRLTGFTPQPYSALSWWDRSVDKRPGSNIIVFAPGHTVGAENILFLARQYFNIPSIQREDIEILPEWRERIWKARSA